MWDVVAQAWRVPEGTFTFAAGHSSRDLVLKVDVDIKLD